MAGGALRQFDWRRPGWYGLGLLWGVVLLSAGIGGGVLQYLGPVLHPVIPELHEHASRKDGKSGEKHQEAKAGHEAAAAEHDNGSRTAGDHGVKPEHGAAPEAAHAAESSHSDTQDAVVSEAPASVGVSPPKRALLEKSVLFPPAQLPRIATDGREARVVYAGPVPGGAAGLPRVALLMAGFGLSERDSRAALDQLPGPVSFAVSAYATVPGLLDAARTAGHELLASLPMEPQGYPANDEGSRSMRTGLSLEDNRKNLEWALSRIQGAVGATGASDGMKGERFADVTGVFDPALEEIGRRGLLYIDPRPGRAVARTGLASRSVDVVLDESPARAEIEAKLIALERVARERGSAVGLAGPLRPVTVERIAAWTATLRDRGLVLVPVSALVGDKP